MCCRCTKNCQGTTRNGTNGESFGAFLPRLALSLPLNFAPLRATCATQMAAAPAAARGREREREESATRCCMQKCYNVSAALSGSPAGHAAQDTQQILHWQLQLQVASPNSLLPWLPSPPPLSSSPCSTLVTLTGPIQALRCDFLRCPLAEKGIKCPLDCQHLLPFCAFCSASAFSLLLLLSFALRYATSSSSLLPCCSARTSVASAALCDTEI